MSSLGFYFGAKQINIVETKGRKLLSNIIIPQTTVSAGELEEKVPVGVKFVEIIALIKDELRRRKIVAREATICLSGKDLIVRTFEIPQLPKNELQSAINFEAKKYIPFKVEDLIADFQLRFDKNSRTNEVVYVGIKKDLLENYISMFNQLDIKLHSLEYSAFSMLRSLGSAGIAGKGTVGILEADIEARDEVNFIVLEDGFPLFSRDIAFINALEGTNNLDNQQGNTALERLKTELRLSLDYYHRKFPARQLKSVFLVSSKEHRADLEAFMMDVGIAVKFVDITRGIDRSLPFSSNFLKAYNAALSRTVKTNLRLNLINASDKLKQKKEKKAAPLDIALFRDIQLDYRWIILGVLICGGTYAHGYKQQQSLQQVLRKTITLRTAIPKINPEISYAELEKLESNFKITNGTFDTLVKKSLYLTEPLSILPKIMPRGVWLTNLTYTKVFTKKGDSKLELIMEGNAYLADSAKELEAVSKLLVNLKEEPEISRHFSEISIFSIDRKPVAKTLATSFVIACKNQVKKDR